MPVTLLADRLNRATYLELRPSRSLVSLGYHPGRRRQGLVLEGERLDESDLLVRTLSEYGIHTTHDDLVWFAQAFWAGSIDLKAQHGWRPPTARDLPQRVYEGLSLALDRQTDELVQWMSLLIEEWKAQAQGISSKFGYRTDWL